MAVEGVVSVTMEVPDIETGVRFYSDAGLVAEASGTTASMWCEGRKAPSIILLGGYDRKRLHHITLQADDLTAIAAIAAESGGRVMDAPADFDAEGLWIEDPHGLLIHLVHGAKEPDLAPAPPFEINGPGRIVRKRRSAILPSDSYPPAKPLRLGHVLLFSPDVPASVEFFTNALGMGLADRSQDIIAFCCARKNSDHHVVAFAKSGDIGLHHLSFQVADPDEVGRGGSALLQKSGRGDWGFGRHTIGSNFFHYIQDPWGSWFEYYSDMDYIDDYALWSPTNYELRDSLANWGPEVPHDFVHNYEASGEWPQAARTMQEAV